MDFTARWWVEKEERFTAKLWVKFGEQWCSKERARARWSTLVTESSRRPRFWREERGREEVDASTLRGATPWTSCTRWGLTSGAGNGIRTTNVAVALPPVGHVGELHLDSDKAMVD